MSNKSARGENDVWKMIGQIGVYTKQTEKLNEISKNPIDSNDVYHLHAKFDT